MSTRCQIRFIDNSGYIAQIYRHSDGYPNGSGGVIHDLSKFMDWYEENPQARVGDPSYAAADFVYWCKTNLFDKTFKKEGYDKLGYGVEPVGDLHGDEEYAYIFNVDTKKITILELNNEPIEKGFENGDIIFDGSLSQAYKKFVKLKDE